jgi:hypothetical protein
MVPAQVADSRWRQELATLNELAYLCRRVWSPIRLTGSCRPTRASSQEVLGPMFGRLSQALTMPPIRESP